MEKARALARGGAWLAAANLLENAGLFLLNLALARRYGAADHGRFVIALSTLGLLRLVFDAGLGPALTRLIASGGGRPALRRAAMAALAVNAPALLLLAALPALRGGQSAGLPLAVFAPWYAALAVQSLACAAFNGLGDLRAAFFASVGLEAARLGALCWLLLAHPRFDVFPAGINAGMAAAAAGMAVLLIAKSARLPGNVAAPSWASLMRLGGGLWIPAAGPAVMSQALPLIVGFTLGPSAVSQYNVITSWSLMAAVAFTPLANAFFGWSARHGAESDPERGRIQAGYFRTLGHLTFAFALLLIAGADRILGLYGNGYRELKPAFLVLVLAQAAEFSRFLTAPLLSGGNWIPRALRMESARILAVLAAVAFAGRIGGSLLSVAGTLLALQAVFGPVRLLDARPALAFAPFGIYARVVLGCAGAFLLAFVPVPPAAVLSLMALALALAGFRSATDIRGILRAPDPR